MNITNIIRSLFLGLGIGLLLQFSSGPTVSLLERVLTVLLSSALGLGIGFATEWLTSLLPIRIARTRTYFALNNAIALTITFIVMLSLGLLFGEQIESTWGWWSVVGVVLVIVCVANVTEYLLYRRTQQRLRALQADLTDSP